MIRTIDIRLNAAHPELPLPEATTYQGAPSTAFLRGVPKACGQWQITAVSVAVTFPDNSTTTRAAVLSAGDVWVATIPACTTSGRTVSGLRIMADGTDENGDAVTGFVLGVADFAVATFDIAPAPGATSYALRYFDNVPNPPHKGDVAKIANVLKYYDGTAWQVFADVDLSNYATKADATLTPVYSSPAGATWSITYPQGWNYGTVSVDPWDGYIWKLDLDVTGETFASSDDINAASFTGTYEGLTVVATRTDAPAGYRLGLDSESNPNRNKLLASEAEAEALRTGKADKPSTAPTNGNFAGWDANGKLTDSGKKPSDFATAAQGAKADAPIQPATRDASNNITSFYAAYRAGDLLGVGQFPSWTAHNLKADASALPASETWTFEVDDGQGGTTTVTKSVAVYAAGGNA